MASFYDVLQVDQNASLDEIKVAFKRRALQVHPDKGGSKEEFHLVYQALETLADPKARKTYDSTEKTKPTGTKTTGRSPFTTGVRHERTKAPGKAQAKKDTPRSRQTSGPSKMGQSGGPSDSSELQTKILIKIHGLLKDLPRDVRSIVLSHEFSQQQRLILEKWMVETSPSAPAKLGPKQLSNEDEESQKDKGHEPCQALALLPSTKFNQRAASSRKRRKRGAVSVSRGVVGCVKKIKAAYRACICFDAIEIYTGQSDLPTALEYLVILTTMKQKMQGSMLSKGTVEERLQEAILSSAEEHGKEYQELNLRFAVFQRAGIFIGSGTQIRSPTTRDVKDFGKIRNALDPFRSYAKRTWLGGSSWTVICFKVFFPLMFRVFLCFLFLDLPKGSEFVFFSGMVEQSPTKGIHFWYSPLHLQDAWEQYQRAIVEAWKVAGVDSSSFLVKLGGLYAANSRFREKHLVTWEKHHMAKQDNWTHQSRKVRARCDRGPDGQWRYWERQQMAMQDKNKHRPRRFRERRRKAQLNHHDKLAALIKLLLRWDRLLKKDAASALRERQKVVRQRIKDKKERKRFEASEKRRLRAEERLRRDNLRKRMKSDFMDDFLDNPKKKVPAEKQKRRSDG